MLSAVMQPVTFNRDGVDEVLVDGGLVFNFPVHCFDGEKCRRECLSFVINIFV